MLEDATAPSSSKVLSSAHSHQLIRTMSPIDKRSERAILEALESLHLPQMPTDGASSHVLRILVVADLDLPSASALAEHTLQQNNLEFCAPTVDLCIACGSFVRDDDLLPYLRGKQSVHQQLDHEQEPVAGRTVTPFFRSKEETAALEGLMTAALSQLESIVCRVVYCPGSQDPITTLFTDRYRRLTPNSRNVHQQWLPLAPGIGCAALLYLDSAENAVKTATSLRTASGKADFDSDHDDASEGFDDEEEECLRRKWSDKWLQVHRNLSTVGYCQTLEGLMRLAPPPDHPVPFVHRTFQTILVTHYVDCCLKMAKLTDSGSQERDFHPAVGPWPTEQHASFLRSDLAQSLLCLEIASGSAANHLPKLIEQGNSQVLLPGSLRERGEFCILEVALLEDERALSGSSKVRRDNEPASPSKQAANSKTKNLRSYAWKLQKVDFHRLSRDRDRV